MLKGQNPEWSFSSKGVKIWEKRLADIPEIINKTSEKLGKLKEKDHKGASVLNREFDRLTENVRQKAGELRTAQKEFEAFKKKLNVKMPDYLPESLIFKY